jgi:hypothetical protein
MEAVLREDWREVCPDRGFIEAESVQVQIHAPSVTGNRLTVRCLEILRVDTNPWQEIECGEASQNATDLAQLSRFPPAPCGFASGRARGGSEPCGLKLRGLTPADPPHPSLELHLG